MQEAFQTLLFVGCPAARLTCQRDVGELVIPLSAVSETLADLALLDLSEESETLVGESVNLDSGSAACGSIGSLSLPEVSETLAGVATRVPSGIPLGFFKVDLLLRVAA